MNRTSQADALLQGADSPADRRTPTSVAAIVTLLALLFDVLSAQMSWFCITSSAPWSTRFAHACAVRRDTMWLFGGAARMGAPQNDVWCSADGESWVRVTAHAAWSARAMHSSVAFHDSLWVLGGYSYRNDVWNSADGGGWNSVTSSAPWPGRQQHQVLVFDDKLWVLGGYGYSGQYNDVWCSENGADWIQVTGSAAWARRGGHSAVVHDNRMWVMGGYDGSRTYNDVWSSANGVEWVLATDSAGWQSRDQLKSVASGDRMWITGGIAGGTQEDDVWYSSDGVTWILASDSAGWPGRAGHSSVVHQDRIWVLGGCWSVGLNDVWCSQGLTGVADTDCTVPFRTAVLGVDPNPCISVVRIAYRLPRATTAKVSVRDRIGREVVSLASGRRGAGSHQICWNGQDGSGRSVPAGVYLICLEGDGLRAVCQTVKLK